MDLRKLSDQELICKTKIVVENERQALTVVLHHLKEMDRRRLFSSLGYQSLYDYVSKELKYPGDQAYRRIAAMKLLKELPEIEVQISEGSLNLTHLNEARKLFRKKLCSREEKLQFLEDLSNKSTRETQKIVVQMVPEAATPDRVRVLDQNKMEFKFTGTYQLEEKLNELKGRLAHSHPQISLGELVEFCVDLSLEKINRKYGLSS